MRKFAIFLMAMTVFGAANAGTYGTIAPRDDVVDVGSLNLRKFHFASDGLVFGCGEAIKENAPDGVHLYFLADNVTIDMKRCDVKWNGNAWEDTTINWCTDKTKCNANMPYKERLGQRYICSRYPMRRFGNTVFSQENDVACVIEDAPVAPVAQPKPVSQPKQVQAVEKVETPPAQVGADPEKIECDATLIALAQSVSTDCPEAQRLAREIIAYCNGETKTLVQMNVYRNTLESALAVCEQNARSVRVTTSLHRSSVSAAEKISAISNKLNAITFDTTVWRDAQGNFNTSRLVSDSVAGVVLGTAGGLITSNVIKKNQIANGFEDLSCAIGGQVVAGWDDEFVVGVK